MATNNTFNMDSMDRVVDNFADVISQSLYSIGKYTVDKAKESFRTRSFENRAWESTLFQTKSNGGIVDSLNVVRIDNFEIAIQSDLAYAAIQNDGGRIKITSKMRKFFWAKFYDTRDSRWKGLALTKKRFLTIEARPFIQDTDLYRSAVNDIVSEEFNKLINR